MVTVTARRTQQSGFSVRLHTWQRNVTSLPTGVTSGYWQSRDLSTSRQSASSRACQRPRRPADTSVPFHRAALDRPDAGARIRAGGKRPRNGNGERPRGSCSVSADRSADEMYSTFWVARGGSRISEWGSWANEGTIISNGGKYLTHFNYHRQDTELTSD